MKRLLLFCLLFPSLLIAEDDAAKQETCQKNLKIIILAFHNYCDVYKTFPPAFTVDKNGKPLHSWRVLILPFLDEAAGLHKKIRLNEPWDSSYNKQFHDKMPAVFRCPACQGKAKQETNYCVVVGKETFGQTDGKGLSLSKMTDGTSNTIAVIESRIPVCWMAPTDILQKDAYLGINKRMKGIGSEHIQGGVNASLCDGSVHFFENNTNLKTLKAVLTIGGGENVNFR